MSAVVPGPRPVDLSVLVVSWRTRDLLDRMLRSLDDAIAGPLGDLVIEVVVVDNASGDGTAEMLAAQFDRPPYTLLLNATNTGFSGGNNAAFASSTGRVVAVLNPDLLVDGDALRRLYDLVCADEHLGLVTAELVDEEGKRQSIHRAFPTIPTVALCFTSWGRRLDSRVLGQRFARRYRLVDRPDHGRIAIDQAAGALLVFRRALVDRIDGYLFDEDLPVLGSDVDLSRRVHDAGLRVELVADERFTHHGGGSLRQVDDARRDVMLWSGLAVYFRKHGNRLEQLALRALGAGGSNGAASTIEARAGGRPLVSIVVISYNYASFLPAALESALAQEHDPIEVIVVDDGSTDDTQAVGMSFATRGVRTMRKPNGGLSQARNFGARHARGEWIVFLDADDELRPAMVRTCLAAAARTGDPLVATNFTAFGAEQWTSAIDAWDVERLKHENYIHASILVRTDLVRAHPYDEANRVGWEDWDFLLDLAEHGVHGTVVPDVLVEYRRHQTNMTHTIAGVTRLDLRRRVLRRHRRFVGHRRWLRAEWRWARVSLATRWHAVRTRAVRRQSAGSRP